MLTGTLGEGAEGDGRTIALGQAETLQDNLVEGGISAAGEETIQLDQQGQVDVFTGGGSAVTLLYVMMSNINTLHQ